VTEFVRALWWQQGPALLAAVAVFGTWFATYFVLYHLLMHARRQIRRTDRRNPLTGDLLRAPGHTLRERMDDLRMDALATVVAVASAPIVILAYLFAIPYFGGTNAPGWWLFGVAWLGSFGFAYRAFLKAQRDLHNHRLGYDAELAVGEELNRLMLQGFRVFHDIPGDKKFNVDHVVVGPTGVFAIETKGRAKVNDERGHKVELREGRLHFPGWSTKQPLEQARMNADWLRDFLTRAVGEPVAVKPVVVLPGWYVELKSRSEVAVLTGKQCGTYFPKSNFAALTTQLIERIAHQLDQRCRDVTPRAFAEV